MVHFLIQMYIQAVENYHNSEFIANISGSCNGDCSLLNCEEVSLYSTSNSLAFLVYLVMEDDSIFAIVVSIFTYTRTQS